MSSSSICAGSEDAIKAVGILGSNLYIGMLALVSWRSIVFFRIEGYMTTTLSAKKLFHLFLLASVILDIPFYLSLVRPPFCFDKPAYASHLFALFCDLCSFSSVIILWAKALSLARDQDRLITWVIAVNAFALVYTLVIVCLVIVSRDFDDFLTGFRQPYLCLFIVHGVILLLYALWLVIYGLKLQIKITSHPRWTPLTRARRMKIIIRINGVLILCTACFLLRVFMLAVRFLQAEIHKNELGSISVVEWYIFSTFIPFLVPASTLLFMMRKNQGATTQQEKGLGGVKGIQSEFEQPLVTPTPSQPLNNREGYWKHHLSTLYSPPISASGGRGVGRIPALDLTVQQEDEMDHDDDGGDVEANVERDQSFISMSIDKI